MFWYQLRNIDTKERLLIYNVMILILLFGANKRQTFTSGVHSLSVPAVFGTHVETVDKYGKAVSLFFLYEVENSGKWKKPIRWIKALSNKIWKKNHMKRKKKKKIPLKVNARKKNPGTNSFMFLFLWI